MFNFYQQYLHTLQSADAHTYLVYICYLTFKKEFFSHCFGSVLVQVHHSNLCTSLTQGVSKCPAYALPSTRHIGHLSIEAHPVEDGAPLDPAENFIISYFTLMQTQKINGLD